MHAEPLNIDYELTPADSRQELFRVSDQQENRLVRENRLHGSNDVDLNFPVHLYIPLAPGSPEAAEQALSSVVARHEALRTRFVYRDDGWWQKIQHDVPVALRSADTPDLKATEELLQEEFGRGFARNAPALIRGLVLRHSSTRSTLVLTSEHLATDLMSMEIIRREFTSFYTGFASGAQVDIAPVPSQFKDWSEWQRKTMADVVTRERLVAFWSQALPSGPYPASPLFHRLDGIEPAVARLAVAHWGSAELEALGTICVRWRMTPFMAVLAAVQLTIAAATHQNLVVVHAPSANRPTEQIASIVGWLAHGLPFGAQIDLAGSLDDGMLASRESTIDVLGHQDLPLTGIVRALLPERTGLRRSLRLPRVFLSIVQSRDAKPTVPINPEVGRAQFLSTQKRWAQPGLGFDIALSPERATVALSYGADRLDGLVAERLCSAIGETLRTVASEPEKPVHELSGTYQALA